MGHFSDPENAKEAGQKGRSHGFFALRDRGGPALEPDELAPLRQIRADIDSHPGRVDLRKDLAWLLIGMIKRAGVTMEETEEDGKSLWSLPIIGKLGVYLNIYLRVLNDIDRLEAKPPGVLYGEELEKIRQVIDVE